MVTLGFMSLSQAHEQGYASELARRAKAQNIQFVRFTPFDLSPDTMLINAQSYHASSGTWNDLAMEIPEYIYDRCFYGRDTLSKKAKPIVDWLKKYPKTTFLGYGLADKWTIQSHLQSHADLKAYLPHTSLVTGFSHLSEVLKKEKACVLKPVSGGGGRGVILLEVSGKSVKATYHIGKNKQIKRFATFNALQLWTKKVLQHSYMIQPYLSIQDKNGYPCDIRILLQKTKNGKWAMVGKAIRKGYQYGFLSNLNGGAEILRFEEWHHSLPKKQQALLLDDLETIAALVPQVLEEKHGPLFELGLDICLANDGKIWLLDVNSKPGRKSIISAEPAMKDFLYESPLNYCSYLAALKEGVILSD
jgi:glutathione synthase/RimK-type ligase-like ATP-grasp enzyme